MAAAYAILESSDVNRRIAVEQVRNGLVRDYQRPLDRAFGLDG